jgi:hypothetical protein
MELATARATAPAHGLDLTYERRPPPVRRRQAFRVTRRAEDPGVGPTAADAGEHADGAGPVTMPREVLVALRDARARLRDVARVAPDAELEAAIASFVALAWDAGFSRVAACSIVAAALEEGLPRRRGRPVSVAAAAWERRARAIYDGIALRA